MAVKELGFTDIRIYNGGIKDWKKSGYLLEKKESLPDTPVTFIEAGALHDLLGQFDRQNCLGDDDQPLLSLIDLRNGNHFPDQDPLPYIATACPTFQWLLDDIIKEEMRARIPKSGIVITVTETGNRDEFAIRYLAK